MAKEASPPRARSARRASSRTSPKARARGRTDYLQIPRTTWISVFILSLIDWIVIRAVRSHEAVVTRPHSSLQAGASLLARLRQWVPVWRGCGEPPTVNPELVADAVTQARDLTSISGVSIRKFLRGLSLKAHGPDGFSVPLLRQLSLEHCEELGRLYRYLEVQGVCPHQWCFSIIIMLPKNPDIERPIGLMCTLHKVLTRLRWGLVEDWIRKSRHLFWYDAAFPGCATLDVMS